MWQNKDDVGFEFEQEIIDRRVLLDAVSIMVDFKMSWN